MIDVKGAFLQGQFENGEVLYIEVPDGFKSWYPDDVVLCMNVPMYGTKQAAYCFFKMFAKHMKDKNYQQLKADPCVNFVWFGTELTLMVAWVDAMMVLGPLELID